MRIILKPLGVVVVCLAMATLAVMAVRGRQQADAPSPVISPPISAKLSEPSDSDAVVYDDGLQNGWENYSWGKNDFAETKSVTAGTCIRGESGKFEAISFHHASINLAPYDRVTFRIHGGDKGGQQLKLLAQYQSAGKTENSAELPISPLTAGKWKTVTVKLAALGVSDKPDVTGFWLQEATGKTLPPYFLDDVRFLRPNETAATE